MSTALLLGRPPDLAPPPPPEDGDVILLLTSSTTLLCFVVAAWQSGPLIAATLAEVALWTEDEAVPLPGGSLQNSRLVKGTNT